MSYHRNNIQVCVLQGDYGCDSDAVAARRRWGLGVIIIAVLQLATRKTQKLMLVWGFANCEHI